MIAHKASLLLLMIHNSDSECKYGNSNAVYLRWEGDGNWSRVSGTHLMLP